jgi:hypothetical protein
MAIQHEQHAGMDDHMSACLDEGLKASWDDQIATFWVTADDTDGGDAGHHEVFRGGYAIVSTAMQQCSREPEALVADIRAFFREVRFETTQEG